MDLLCLFSRSNIYIYIYIYICKHRNYIAELQINRSYISIGPSICYSFDGIVDFAKHSNNFKTVIILKWKPYPSIDQLLFTKAKTKPSKLWQLLPCLGKVGRDADIESSYYKNLIKLLEDLIASCDGTSHPVHCYSADDLIRATNKFHPSCIVRKGSNCTTFRGFLNDRSIIIAKHSVGRLTNEDGVRSRAIRNIVISIQMSNHENLLKLLGCCLQFPVPALVLENAAKGVLQGDGSLRGDNEDESLLLPWKTRLCIAKKLAGAVTYLHTSFPSPVIHRDLKPGCISWTTTTFPNSPTSHSP